MALRLRVKTRESTQVIQGLESSNNIGDLKALIQAAFDLKPASFKLRAGFPPKNIDSSDESSLESCGINNGETIIVEHMAQTAAQTSVEAVSLLGEDVVPVNSGILRVRQMKDDNSCLFRSIGYLFFGDAETCQQLRQTVALFIREHSEYSEVVLGQPPSRYCEWITFKDSWGGSIEIAIFSEYFQTEIISIDVQTLRVDRYNQGKYEKFCILLYSGIHYDAIAWSERGNDKTTFECKTSQNIVEAAVKLAEIWHKKKKYTDLAGFTLKCDVCKTGIKGEKQAQEHAKNTGHASFSEYNS